MQYDWFNRYNSLERDGPFATISQAKRHAVSVFNQIQDGFAFDIAIVEHDTTKVVDHGYIQRYKWRNGDYVASPGEPGAETEKTNA